MVLAESYAALCMQAPEFFFLSVFFFLLSPSQPPHMYTYTCIHSCVHPRMHAHTQGAFVYQLVAETTLPAPMMECKGVIALEGPTHTFDIFIPFSNSQVRTVCVCACVCVVCMCVCV